MWPARKGRVSMSVNVRPIVSRIGLAGAGVRAYSLFRTTGPNTGDRVRIASSVTASRRIRAP